MKRPAFITKISEKLSVAIKFAMVGFAVAVVGFGMLKAGVPVWKEFETSFAYRDFKKYGVIGTYRHRFFGAFEKIQGIESLDRENQELNVRLAQIEKQFEIERARHAEAEMKAITEDLSDRLRDEAGTELARVLPAISYTVPTNLLPHQLYALSLGYFRKQEYEQAAVLFHHLLNMQEDTIYQRGEVQLLSAISWYHLKNFKLARHYLRSVVKGANQSTALYRTASIWEAILAKAEGKKAESQRILTAALAKFPHSPESAWINTRHTKGIEHKDGERKDVEREVAGHEIREPNQALMRHVEDKASHEEKRNEAGGSEANHELPKKAVEERHGHEEKHGNGHEE